MDKSLGVRLADEIKEVCEIEATKTQLESCLFSKKINDKINNGANSIEISLKSGAEVYGVNYNNYYDKIESIKSKYLIDANNLSKEYEFQFVNLQLELRELLSNQKIALVNAKKCLDLKKEQTDKNFSDAYNKEKEKYLGKFYLYNSLIKDCEFKIQNCMTETYSEIDNVINEMSEMQIAVDNENFFNKFINKITNIFSGKSKFESKLGEFEEKANSLSNDNIFKIERIKNNTVSLVEDILNKKENMNMQNA